MSWKAELEKDMSLIKLGDQAAFESLYIKTSSRLYGLLIKILSNPDLACDVLQESYVKIWLNCSQYHSTSGDPWPWICQLTRHCALDSLRKNKRAERIADASELYEETLTDTCTEQALFENTGYALHSCLAKLREGPRQAITLAYFYGFSHSELAVKLGQPLGTLKTWIKRGLQEVEKCLRD
ncbi:RNA polymerase sigma factor [Marinomonas epiphytica]